MLLLYRKITAFRGKVHTSCNFPCRCTFPENTSNPYSKQNQQRTNRYIRTTYREAYNHLKHIALVKSVRIRYAHVRTLGNLKDTVLPCRRTTL